MLKRLSYSMAIFCMSCSSAIASLQTECSCKKRPQRSVDADLFIESEKEQEIMH
jgi:hypothetical protein